MAYTKEELIAALTKAVGDTEYGKEIIADAEAHACETGKYAQDMKDRLDERLATLEGWEKKHTEEGDVEKASVEAEKRIIAGKALAAVEAL